MSTHPLVRVLLGGVLTAMAIGSLLVACSQGAALRDVPGVAFEPVAPAPSTVATAPTPAVDPTAISIPAIDVRSTEEMLALGLTDDCPDGVTPPCLDSPPVDRPGQPGWYAGADPVFNGDEYQPGEPGPAVIAAHVDGTGPNGEKGYPGLFARLGELELGDEIVVERGALGEVIFVVYGIERHGKNDFPTQRVYGPTEGPELRLLTCAGEFSGGHYEDNLVVWARLA